MLEYGIWGNLDFCFWDMVIHIWLKNMLFLETFAFTLMFLFGKKINYTYLLLVCVLVCLIHVSMCVCVYVCMCMFTCMCSHIYAVACMDVNVRGQP